MPVSAVRSVAVRSTTSGLPTLRQGARGGYVSLLQQKLNAHGARLSVDGDFGPNTRNAVLSFQRSHGLTADGVVGPRTWAALNGAGSTPAPSGGTTTGPVLRQGARGSAVSALQQKLRAHGYNVSVDGDFGPNTRNAVVAFQRARGLTADGVVGPRTWAALGGGSVSGGGSVGGGSTGGTRTTGYRNGVPVSITIKAVGNGEYMESRAADAFNRMKADAARAGVSLVAVSGFRTMAEQQRLYSLYLQHRGNLAARPGYSNHQMGLSVDVSTGGSYSSAQYRWLAAHGRAYGFVNDVGGEPWHWTFRG